MTHSMYAIDILFFFFNDTATTEIYTLSLHDALPISDGFDGWMEDFGEYTPPDSQSHDGSPGTVMHNLYPTLYHGTATAQTPPDRKSTRLNSSHANISYAVFCLKKKNNN